MSTKQCPVPGCPNRCSNSVLMCRDHWYSVPARLRTAVNRTWRGFQASDNVDELQLNRAAYEAARDKAIAAARPEL